MSTRVSAGKRLWRGLGAQVIGLVLLAVLVTGGLIGWLVTEHSRNVLRDSVLSQNLATAVAAGELAAQFVDVAKTSLDHLEIGPIFSTAVGQHDVATAETHMGELMQVSGRFDSVSVYSPDGVGWASGLKAAWQYRGGSVADREWFQHVMATKKPYLGVPYVSRETGHPVVVYASPMLDDQGKVTAVLAGGISLTALSDAIEGIAAGESAPLNLVDTRQGGLVVAASDSSLVLKPASSQDEALAQSLAGNRKALETPGSGGEADLVAYAPVQGAPWSVLIREPAKTAFAPVYAATRRAIFIVVGILAAALLSGLLVARRITSPLRSLVKAADAVGGGNLDYKIGTSRRDEIGVASNAFDHMTAELKGTLVSRDELAMEVAERKRAEEALRLGAGEKAILSQIAGVFLTVSDEAMYAEVLAVVLRVMKSMFGVFGFIADNGDLVIPSLTRGIWDECQVHDKSMVFPADSWGESLWGRAIRDRRAYYSSGPFRTPEGHIRVDHFLAVPVVFREETIGLISVANKEGGYAEEDKELLERIASTISPILRARLQRNVQERRRVAAEKDLKESEEKYRLLVANAGEAIFIVQDEVVKFPNPKTLEMMGYTAEELSEVSLVDLIHPLDRSAVLDGRLRLLEGERRREAYPFRIVNKEARELWVQLNTAPIIWEEKPGLLCFLRDVTEQKTLEAQFAQAQKMEAVGQFAGGVAHDFNNMLTVVIGNAGLALVETAPSSSVHARLREIEEAARHSVDLTRQLLAFARRQTIAPRVLDLNETVSGMLSMVRRLVGEDIDLAWMPGAELWTVKLDPIQIDQVLANLCINARDAINGVGKITIETENVTLDETYCLGHVGFIPGEYVLLAVSDDGCGMDEETRLHLFEPFFTTKGVGQGTGLGLATVYGIVKQNDGFTNVYSEPGQGTTFKIYLPRHEAEAAGTSAESAAAKPRGGSETVLMVEDERAILDLGKTILEESGYKLLIAETPREALALMDEYAGDVHLLITDVVMPEMNGRELAERLASVKPGLKCLYMSGYTADVIAHRGILEEGVNFIQKPFSLKDLAARVREVLDQD